MNTMPPSIMNGDNNTNNQEQDNISGNKLNYHDALADHMEMLKLSSSNQQQQSQSSSNSTSGLSFWNNTFSTGGGSGMMLPAAGAGTQEHGTFNAEDLLELHRKQILQNTTGAGVGNLHNGFHSVPTQTQRSNATTPDAAGTSASSTVGPDLNGGINYQNGTNLQQQSFANSRWSNMSSPALQYYGQNNPGNNATSENNAAGNFAAAPGSHNLQNLYISTGNGISASIANGQPHSNSNGSMISNENIVANVGNANQTAGGGTSALPVHWNSNVITSNHQLQQQPSSGIASTDLYNPQGTTPPAAGGVFYMAVPSAAPNNNTTLQLQPVQMMQLPNGQQTLVFASHASTGIPNSHSMPNLQVLTTAPNNANSNQAYRAAGAHSQSMRNNGNGRRNQKGHHRNKQDDSNSNLSNKDMYGSNSISTKSSSNNLVEDTARNSNEDSSGNGAQSQADIQITALYQSPHRPHLQSLLGHVRRLSRDQVGCRLLQQCLDEDGPAAASSILNEGLPFLGEAMTDPFGNYLFQKILEKVSKDERLLLVKSVAPRLVNAALNLHGTRSVQKVIEVVANDLHMYPANDDAAHIIVDTLQPHIARLCIDSHGNHVVQRILQRLPHSHNRFVFEAVALHVNDVARHRHGCCVIQRCLDFNSENGNESSARTQLVNRIVDKSIALDLMQDAYGNYVVQYVLDVCGDDEAAAVCESVVGMIAPLAVQKFSSNVIEKCLERSSDRVQELYLQEMSHPQHIRQLMSDPFGNYVVQRGLSVATHSQAVRLVEAMKMHLPGMRNTAGGRRILSKITRRFPNFTLQAQQVSLQSQQQTEILAQQQSNQMQLQGSVLLNSSSDLQNFNSTTFVNHFYEYGTGSNGANGGVPVDPNH